MEKRILLIVNPFSGRMRSRTALMDIVKTLCDADFSVNVHVTRCRRDATRIAREESHHYDLLVACGGDGTLSEMMAGVIQANYRGEVGFLPAGTTNDMANTLGLPRNLLKASQLLTYGKPSPVDYGSFNQDQYFGYIASFGAFTETSYQTDQRAKNVWGHLAYVAEGIGAVGAIRPWPMEIQCDGKTVSGNFIFGAAANSLSIGGILKLKKSDVDLSDGLHELLLIRAPEQPGDLSSIIAGILAGDFDREHTVFLKGRHMEFLCREPIPWCLDGEYAGSWKSATVDNLPGRMAIIRP